MTDTDWIIRFSKGLDENAGPAERERILEGVASFCPEKDPEGTARWIAGSIERMEGSLDRPACERVMLTCSHRYPENKMIEYRALYERTGDIDLVLRRICEDTEAAGLSFVKRPEREGDEILFTKVPCDPEGYRRARDDVGRRFHYCHCDVVRELVRMEDGRISRTFCTCGGGWYASLWRGIMGEPVEVELVESVLQGATAASSESSSQMGRGGARAPSVRDRSIISPCSGQWPRPGCSEKTI